MNEFGWIAIFPEDLLVLLWRVAAGEEPLAVYAEVVIGSDRLDREGDDEWGTTST